MRAAKLTLPEQGGEREIFDLASLTGAGPQQLSFFAGGKPLRDHFLQSRAGFCLVPHKRVPPAPVTMTRRP